MLDGVPDEVREHLTQPRLLADDDARAAGRAVDQRDQPGGPRRVEGVQVADGVGGEESRLRQVLANLVGNTVQHTPRGTPVEIAVGLLPTGEAAIEVRDHGPGIDPEHAARVFERFYRVDASRGRDSGGAGLGMAIVAAIVAAHDGSVRLAQTPGGGTTVQIALPVPAHDPQV